MASSHNPIQGRIVLTQVRPSVIHYPARGKAASLTIRSWLADWSEFPSKASITFQNNEEDTHLEFELSKPYYDRARQLLTFDIQGKIVLTPYSTIRDVQLFVHE
ncbi:MAG: hypothetical protein S4CHLAM81_06980 [Chlamydiales bacterium]|nr:hypothetical protein [Chlamydiales bacterium]MCH9635482.1 hypothetical protein [Chlamydiales bacterium]